MYKWQRIKALHAQGVSIRQIAATVGVSRNTVRKYLREAGPPQFKAREYVKELDNTCYQSHKKVWWICCDNPEHHYLASVQLRAKELSPYNGVKMVF